MHATDVENRRREAASSVTVVIVPVAVLFLRGHVQVVFAKRLTAASRSWLFSAAVSWSPAVSAS